VLLKEVYNKKFLNDLSSTISSFESRFLNKKFLEIIENSWEEKSLKQRMREISLALNECLNFLNYQEKIDVLKRSCLKLPKDKNSGLALIIFPDFIENFGLQDFDFSSEFAVRKFLKLDEKKALKFFLKWAKSENYHVRRLASEGCRPRLPWGEALVSFKKNPQEIIKILELLKFDSKKYVQKSVANNLNDISKDNEEILIELLKKWKKEGVNDFIIKHSLRTLLKKANKKALQLIDIKGSKQEKLVNFILTNEEIKIAQNLDFSFKLENLENNNKIRLEYAVYFLKKDGTHGKKNFQIATKNFQKGVFEFYKKHSFKDLSTRKHNAGKHFISLVVNGVELAKQEFYLSK